VLFVPKKNETVRMCIDYRVLNKLTERDEFPLPRIDELLDTLSETKYFLVLDLDIAYHQVRLNEEDIPKTAFTCSQEHYEFMVMTFRFTNTSVIFQRMMTQVFDLI
jgi:Reverse transcriptase (RNA-dependent DNA polymerase)